MTELEKHREIWQGKSDEWLFERLALELKDKVETIHQLLAENEQLRIANVVGQSEQLKAVEKLKDFAYEVCPLHREDDLEQIVGSL